MITNVRKTTVLFVFLLPVLSLLGTGCAGYRIVRTVEAQPMKSTTLQQSANQEDQQDPTRGLAQEQQEQTAMSAIEDFLERTREYHEQDTNRSSVQPRQAMTEMTRNRESQFDSTQPVSGYPISTSPADQHSFSRGMIVANGKVELEQQRSTKPTLALPIVQSVVISLAGSIQSTSTEPIQTNTVNDSLEVTTDQQPFSLDHYVSQLEKRASTTKDFDSEWQLRLMQLVMGRDERAKTVSDRLSAASQPLLQALMTVAISVRDALRNPTSNFERVLTQVDELRRMVAREGDPVVSAIALCRQVVTFGVYDELSKQDLIAGRSTQSIVYCEIDNFSSDAVGDGQYETRLGSRLELLTAEGQTVWQKEEPEIIDRCRRQRKDFFIAQRVTFPATLAGGDYVLKVMVEDKLTGRASEAIYPFEIIDPMAVAQNH